MLLGILKPFQIDEASLQFLFLTLFALLLTGKREFGINHLDTPFLALAIALDGLESISRLDLKAHSISMEP